ncbi:MAG: universal stress protein [Anaerolineae bacterium]|nr:universal stress protein [Anaerolineae bacterium]NUQ05670.1 universal stress protein [Anaerolineae bacterium]
MIKRILVPLDGSELSERAVPWACEIARGVGACIVLLGVVPPPSGRWGGLFRSVTEFTQELPESETDLDRSLHPVSKDSQMASLESEVMRKLLPVADTLREQSVEATVVVGFGHPVDGILDHIVNDSIDLVVMSTHGHHGLHPYAYGSTSDRVARHSPVPVMLVRPQEVTHMLPLPRILGGT